MKNRTIILVCIFSSTIHRVHFSTPPHPFFLKNHTYSFLLLFLEIFPNLGVEWLLTRESANLPFVLKEDARDVRRGCGLGVNISLVEYTTFLFHIVIQKSSLIVNTLQFLGIIIFSYPKSKTF